MEIEYVIRNLKLYEPIVCDGVENGGQLFNCTTDVNEKNQVPENGVYISLDEGNSNNVIPEGNYLFVQGILFSENEGFPLVKEVLDAAEKLWLEFLWTEKKAGDSKIFMRVLKEEHGFVFQLMRGVL